MDEDEFDELWKKSPRELARELADPTKPRISPYAETQRAILDSKFAEAHFATARWTKLLAIATFVLAAVTVVAVIVGVA